MFGLTPVATRGLLGLVVDLLRGGTEIPIGALFHGPLRQRAAVGAPSRRPGRVRRAVRRRHEWYGGEDYRVAQLAWPDRNGWLPWESGFDHRLMLAQPVVGAVDEVAT